MFGPLQAAHAIDEDYYVALASFRGETNAEDFIHQNQHQFPEQLLNT